MLVQSVTWLYIIIKKYVLDGFPWQNISCTEWSNDTGNIIACLTWCSSVVVTFLLCRLCNWRRKWVFFLQIYLWFHANFQDDVRQYGACFHEGISVLVFELCEVCFKYSCTMFGGTFLVKITCLDVVGDMAFLSVQVMMVIKMTMEVVFDVFTLKSGWISCLFVEALSDVSISRIVLFKWMGACV